MCPRHHALKHPDLAEEHRWRARRLPGGVIEWQSPGGRIFTDDPPPHVSVR